MDDALVYGKDEGEHDERLRNAPKRIRPAGITLNRDKCVFGVSEITSLGVRINEDSPDAKKVEAIRNLKAPKDVSR